MNIIEEIYKLKENNKSFVLATVVKTSGSAPGKTGFKMIIEPGGKTKGTVGGGAIEVEVINEAEKILNNGENRLQEYTLSDEVDEKKSTAKVVPMKCSGKVTIFYEVFGSYPFVYIFGGGHVGKSLLYFLNPLNYYKILIDNREEFANRNVNPFADEYILSGYKEFADKFNPPENSFIIILTHGHKFDYDILHSIYKRKLNVNYIGVIASKSKAQSMKEQLKNDIGSDVDMSKLHTPIGLKIGGNSAEDIALSIAAEIQKFNYQLND